MNRRDFVRSMAILPAAVLALPAHSDGVALQSIAHPTIPPLTAEELTRWVEALFVDVVVMEPKAYVEFAQITIGSDEVPVYRMVPVTWRMRGNSEAELVAQAWEDMQRVAAEQASGTLFWRKKPGIVPWGDFDSGERGVVLRFRVAVRPHDWVERAQRGVRQSGYWIDRGEVEGSQWLDKRARGFKGA